MRSVAARAACSAALRCGLAIFWNSVRGAHDSRATRPIEARSLDFRLAHLVLRRDSRAGHTPESGSGNQQWEIGSARSSRALRSEEHTSELQSLMRNSYAVL